MWYGCFKLSHDLGAVSLWVVTHDSCSSSKFLCISGFLLKVFILFSCLSTVCRLAAKLPLCIRVFWCLLCLWSVKTFYFRMSGETNYSTSSISRTRSKYCNPQNMNSMYLLNHRKSVLSWSITLCIPRGRAKSHVLLIEVMLLHIHAHVPPVIATSMKMTTNILSNSYCFEIQGCLCHS